MLDFLARRGVCPPSLIADSADEDWDFRCPEGRDDGGREWGFDDRRGVSVTLCVSGSPMSICLWVVEIVAVRRRVSGMLNKSRRGGLFTLIAVMTTNLLPAATK